MDVWMSAQLFGASALYVIVEYCAHGCLDVCTTVWCRCSVCDRGLLCSWMSAQLFGAGALYVIVEYCAHGCLRNYLVKNRGAFIDTLDYSIDKPMPRHHAANNDYVNSPHINPSPAAASLNTDSPTLTTKDLICFAFQISRGMEYLVSRNVSFY